MGKTDEDKSALAWIHAGADDDQGLHPPRKPDRISGLVNERAGRDLPPGPQVSLSAPSAQLRPDGLLVVNVFLDHVLAVPAVPVPVDRSSASRLPFRIKTFPEIVLFVAVASM